MHEYIRIRPNTGRKGQKMKWEVIVNNEWIYEGNYEQAEELAMGYWADPDFWGDCQMISEAEFYGYDE